MARPLEIVAWWLASRAHEKLLHAYALMIKRLLMAACFVALACVPACGTAFSRGSGVAVGAYPFQAVAIDGYFISKTFNQPEDFMGMTATGPLFLLWGLVSLPVDLVIDAILLPIDLGAWMLGAYKQGRRARALPDSRGG